MHVGCGDGLALANVRGRVQVGQAATAEAGAVHVPHGLDHTWGAKDTAVAEAVDEVVVVVGEETMPHTGRETEDEGV